MRSLSCKTTFPLLGPAKLYNNVSETLIVKKTVIDCLQLSDTKTRDDKKIRHFQEAAFSFSGWIGLVKTWQNENDWKINNVWWTIKINLHTLVDTICGYKLPTNLQNFRQKDLTEVKIFQKVLRGGGLLFWNTLYFVLATASNVLFLVARVCLYISSFVTL